MGFEEGMVKGCEGQGDKAEGFADFERVLDASGLVEEAGEQ